MIIIYENSPCWTAYYVIILDWSVLPVLICATCKEECHIQTGCEIKTLCFQAIMLSDYLWSQLDQTIVCYTPPNDALAILPTVRIRLN